MHWTSSCIKSCILSDYSFVSSQIRANLKRWATTRGGAVLPPLEDHELNNQMKYVGMFPELVDQMLETQLDLLETEAIA